MKSLCASSLDLVLEHLVGFLDAALLAINSIQIEEEKDLPEDSPWIRLLRLGIPLEAHGVGSLAAPSASMAAELEADCLVVGLHTAQLFFEPQSSANASLLELRYRQFQKQHTWPRCQMLAVGLVHRLGFLGEEESPAGHGLSTLTLLS